MSWKGKRKDAGTLTGDGDPAPKKSAKQDDQEEDDNIFICELSNNRMVSVKSWLGMVIVDIREFYLKDGKKMPGRKGISLTMDQWKVLRERVEDIDKAVSGKS